MATLSSPGGGVEVPEYPTLGNLDRASQRGSGRSRGRSRGGGRELLDLVCVRGAAVQIDAWAWGVEDAPPIRPKTWPEGHAATTAAWERPGRGSGARLV